VPTAPLPKPRRPAAEPPPAAPRPAPRRRPVWLPVLGGFVLGAGTVLFMVWVYGRQGGLGPAFGPATAPNGAPVEGYIPNQPSQPGAGAAPGAPMPAPKPGSGSGLPSNSAPPWNPPGPATGAPGTPAGPGAPALPGAPSAPGAAAPAPAATAADVELLRGRHLLVPVQGVRPEDVKDSFSDPRGGGRVHDALDVMAPRNTPVLAVEDGKVAKLFQSRQGGNTIYQFDPTATYCYYYAHLDRYADDLREGGSIHRGQLLGFVGSTGNADSAAPHLHFAIFRLTPDRHWWQGTPLNPYLLFHSR
jgi:murein DD-endopeptidase MepM/ murein hydrolase activator NlpD